MKKNISTFDAFIRISLGFAGLGYSIICASRKANGYPWTMLLLSSMKIAEGITRYCPTLSILGKSTINKERNYQ